MLRNLRSNRHWEPQAALSRHILYLHKDWKRKSHISTWKQKGVTEVVNKVRVPKTSWQAFGTYLIYEFTSPTLVALRAISLVGEHLLLSQDYCIWCVFLSLVYNSSRKCTFEVNLCCFSVWRGYLTTPILFLSSLSCFKMFWTYPN